MESSEPLTFREPQDATNPARESFLFRMLSGKRRELFFWIAQIFFWAGMGLLGLLLTLSFRAAAPGVGVVLTLRMATGFFQSLGLRWIYQRPAFRQRGKLAKWSLAFTSMLALVLLEVIILECLKETGIALPGSAESFGMKLVAVRYFVLSLWSSLYFAFHLLEAEHALIMRTTRAELAARENELRHLQAQMNPHFLLNALGSVIACREDPEAVKEVTQSLSNYLRFLLQETRPLEPLSRELDALEKYLTVQTSRFQGKLFCRIQIGTAARAVMVPPMLIQPLLEDAFHHHTPTSELPLHVWLTASEEKEFLVVSVSNTCPLSPDGSEPAPGNGFIALRHRLDLLLGSRAKIQRKIDHGWVRVIIHIPRSANTTP